VIVATRRASTKNAASSGPAGGFGEGESPMQLCMFRRTVRHAGTMMLALLLPLPLFATAGSPDAEILTPGAVARKAPDPTSPIIAELSAGTQVEVFVTLWGQGGNWAQIGLPSGGSGFVPEQTLRRLTVPKQWRSAGSGSGPSSTKRRAGVSAVDVPLKRFGGLLLVTARVNDQVTTYFILDTGASTITISHTLANQLGLEYENQPKQTMVTPSGIMSSPRIVLGSVYVPDDRGAGVEGVEAVVATLPGHPPEIAGLLGQSFLRHFHVTIDAERRVMHLQPIRP
jgi:predicted aspartyl protease